MSTVYPDGNPLAYACATCGAQPGEPCINYRGNKCGPHSSRNEVAWEAQHGFTPAPSAQMALPLVDADEPSPQLPLFGDGC